MAAKLNEKSHSIVRKPHFFPYAARFVSAIVVRLAGQGQKCGPQRRQQLLRPKHRRGRRRRRLQRQEGR